MSDKDLERPAVGLSPLAKTSLPRLGEYEILAEIAKGGMGRVYLARRRGQAGFERLFAVKVLHEHMMDEPEAMMMLLDEANIACRLHHPNVVPIVDIGEHDEGHYLVLEYVEGCALQQLLRRCDDERPARLIIPMIIDALRGLHAAHELTDSEGAPSNLVHRDFSPHNLMIGVGGTCRVTDFGIAKVAARLTVTHGKFNKGKLAYMSPEQLSAAVDIDRRADVWAAGVVLWSALTGEHPFRGDSEAVTTTNILRRDVPKPSTVGLKPPDCFDIVCEKALKRDREQRFDTAMDMADELHQIAVKNEMLGSPSEVAAWVQDAFKNDFKSRERAIRTLRSEAEHANLPILPRLFSSPGDSQSASLPGMASFTPSTGPSALRRQEMYEEDDGLRDSEIPVVVDPRDLPTPIPEPRETLGPPVLAPNKGRKIPLWMIVGVPIVVVLALVIGLFLGNSGSSDDEGSGHNEGGETAAKVGAGSGQQHATTGTDGGATSTLDAGENSAEVVPDGSAVAESGTTRVGVTLRGLPAIARVRVDGHSVEGHSFQLSANGFEHIIRVDAVGYFQWTHRIVTPVNSAQDLVIDAEMIVRQTPGKQPGRPEKRPSKFIRDPGF